MPYWDSYIRKRAFSNLNTSCESDEYMEWKKVLAWLKAFTCQKIKKITVFLKMILGL